jgi:hypothetical protein
MFKIKNILYALFVLIIGLLFTEVTLRKLGYEPFNSAFFDKAKEAMKNVPSDYIPDSTLGFKPRIRELVRYADNDTNIIRFTIDSTSCRITSFEKNTFDKQIITDGCSFTFGDNLDDTETSSFKLQKKLWPYKIKVKNISCGGYGTTQFYLQIKNLDNSRHNILALVLNYSVFHDARAILARSWRSVLIHGQNTDLIMPFSKVIDDSLMVSYKMIDYKLLPLQDKSALINKLDDIRNKYEDKNAACVSKKLLKEIVRLCKEKDITLILTGLTNDTPTSDMIDYFNNLGVQTLKYNLDLNVSKYNFLPYDNHPNATAHAIFADSIFYKLDRLYGFTSLKN